MYQLVVPCREILAKWSTGRRNLVEDLSRYLFDIRYFKVYLKGLFLVVSLLERITHPCLRQVAS
jgi:hypothetical protein